MFCLNLFNLSLVIIGFIYFSFPILKKYLVILFQDVLGIKYQWNKSVDKPRIFFLIMLTPIFYFSGISLNKISFPTDFFNLKDSLGYLQLFTYILYLGTFIVILFLSNYIWSEKFENSFLPLIKKKVINISINKHEIHIDDTKLKKIYTELKQYDFINSDILFENFKSAINFIENKDIKVVFNMSGPDFRCLFELFKKHNTNKKLEFKSFLLNNKMIVKSDEKPYNYSTLKDSKYNTSKNNQTLKKIFTFKSTDY